MPSLGAQMPRFKDLFEPFFIKDLKVEARREGNSLLIEVKPASRKTRRKRLGHPKNPRKNTSLNKPPAYILFIKMQILFKYALQQNFSTSTFGVVPNVFTEVLAYKNVSINEIGYFYTIFSFSGLIGEYVMCRRARTKVEDSQFSKDAKPNSTKPYSASLPSKARKQSTTYAKK